MIERNQLFPIARRWKQTAVAGIFFLIGVGLALLLYQWGDRGGTPGVFAWGTSTSFAPLVAVLLVAISATIVAAWVVQSTGIFPSDRGRKVLALVSTIWIGFASGLFSPAALGLEGSWQRGVSTTNSVVYSLQLHEFEMPEEMKDVWEGQKPGPYATVGPRSDLWLALNSSAAPVLRMNNEKSVSGQVVVSRLTPEFSQLGEAINLTSLDSRIQHVRDVQAHPAGLIFSNLELKRNCLVLQVWLARLGEDVSEFDSLDLEWESPTCLSPDMSLTAEVNGSGSGGRLAVAEDGSIFLTVGDFGMAPTDSTELGARPAVLAPDGCCGKILRLDQDMRTEIVSTGHDNPQGLHLDPISGLLWSSEHGPNGGGELNLVVLGSDYGWPDVTVGVPYGPNLPESNWSVGRWASDHPGFQAPLLAWMPAVAPSQVLVYSGEEFPAWKGDLVVAAMKDESLRRIRLNEGRVLFDERIAIGERTRDLIQLEDGRLLLTFDSGKMGVLSLPSHD